MEAATQGRPQGINTGGSSARRQHEGPGPDSDGQCGEEGTWPRVSRRKNWLRKEEESVAPGAPGVGDLWQCQPRSRGRLVGQGDSGHHGETPHQGE